MSGTKYTTNYCIIMNKHSAYETNMNYIKKNLDGEHMVKHDDRYGYIAYLMIQLADASSELRNTLEKEATQ